MKHEENSAARHEPGDAFGESLHRVQELIDESRARRILDGGRSRHGRSHYLYASWTHVDLERSLQVVLSNEPRLEVMTDGLHEASGLPACWALSLLLDCNQGWVSWGREDLQCPCAPEGLRSSCPCLMSVVDATDELNSGRAVTLFLRGRGSELSCLTWWGSDMAEAGQGADDGRSADEGHLEQSRRSQAHAARLGEMMDLACMLARRIDSASINRGVQRRDRGQGRPEAPGLDRASRPGSRMSNAGRIACGMSSRLLPGAASEQFSRREIEVIEGLLDGSSSSEIARRLELSNAAISFHVANLCRKLGVSGQKQAIARLMGLGYLRLQSS